MTLRTAGRAVLVAVFLGSLSAGLAAQDEDAGLPLGSTPPPATVEDLAGKPVALDRLLRKRPALIEFWATWCPLCRALEPKLAAAYARYHDRVTILAIAVAVNESPATVRRHLVRHPMPFPFLWDTNGNATRAFQAPTTSYIVVLDRTGTVAYTGTGADQDLDRALARVTSAY